MDTHGGNHNLNYYYHAPNFFGSGTDADSSKIGWQLLVQSTSARIWITYQSVEQWKCSIWNVFQNTNHVVQVNGEDNKENIVKELRKNIEKIQDFTQIKCPDKGISGYDRPRMHSIPCFLS